jgi:hypothetical protein
MSLQFVEVVAVQQDTSAIAARIELAERDRDGQAAYH